MSGELTRLALRDICARLVSDRLAAGLRISRVRDDARPLVIAGERAINPPEILFECELPDSASAEACYQHLSDVETKFRSHLPGGLGYFSIRVSGWVYQHDGGHKFFGLFSFARVEGGRLHIMIGPDVFKEII